MRWLLSHFMLLIWGCELAIGPQGPQPASQAARQLTGWTTWKQHTELHKESSQSFLTPPTPSTGGQRLRGGGGGGVEVQEGWNGPLVGCFGLNSRMDSGKLYPYCYFLMNKILTFIVFIYLFFVFQLWSKLTKYKVEIYHTSILPSADRKHLKRGRERVSWDKWLWFLVWTNQNATSHRSNKNGLPVMLETSLNQAMKMSHKQKLITASMPWLHLFLLYMILFIYFAILFSHVNYCFLFHLPVAHKTVTCIGYFQVYLTSNINKKGDLFDNKTGWTHFLLELSKTTESDYRPGSYIVLLFVFCERRTWCKHPFSPQPVRPQYKTNYCIYTLLNPLENMLHFLGFGFCALYQLTE